MVEALAEGDTEALAEGDTEGLAEDDTEGLAEGDADGLAEGDGEGLGDGPHNGAVTVLVSSVTAPSSAYSPPSSSAPVVMVIEVLARMRPLKSVLVPSVAELPTWKNTLQLLAPLRNTTLALLAVVKVLATWKMKTLSGLPSASSVSAPVSCADDVKQ
jgi:hypothetical protein